MTTRILRFVLLASVLNIFALHIEAQAGWHCRRWNSAHSSSAQVFNTLPANSIPANILLANTLPANSLALQPQQGLQAGVIDSGILSKLIEIITNQNGGGSGGPGVDSGGDNNNTLAALLIGQRAILENQNRILEIVDGNAARLVELSEQTDRILKQLKKNKKGSNDPGESPDNSVHSGGASLKGKQSSELNFALNKIDNLEKQVGALQLGLDAILKELKELKASPAAGLVEKSAELAEPKQKN